MPAFYSLLLTGDQVDQSGVRK